MIYLKNYENSNEKLYFDGNKLINPIINEYEKVNYVIITSMLIDEIYDELEMINENYHKNHYSRKEFINKIITNGHDLGYSGGEITSITTEAKKSFASTLKNVPDSELKNHPFDFHFL